MTILQNEIRIDDLVCHTILLCVADIIRFHRKPPFGDQISSLDMHPWMHNWFSSRTALFCFSRVFSVVRGFNLGEQESLER